MIKKLFTLKWLASLGQYFNKNKPYSASKKFFFYKIPFRISEYFCIGFFSLEILSRIYAYPKRRHLFLKNFMNMIDVIAVLPNFLEITLSWLNDEEKANGFVTGLTVFRILRILRMLKLTKLDSITIVFRTVKKSRQEIGVLIIMIVTFMVIYST